MTAEFADDSTVMGLISKHDETMYREEVEHLVSWCTDNNLMLNVTKTKEMIINFRRSQSEHTPL